MQSIEFGSRKEKTCLNTLSECYLYIVKFKNAESRMMSCNLVLFELHIIVWKQLRIYYYCHYQIVLFHEKVKSSALYILHAGLYFAII